MRIKELSADQFRRYFEARLQGHKFQRSTGGVVTTCCFHDDRNPSLSLNFDKGVWRCHTGCGGGGIIDFEKRFSQCDNGQAISNISELIGEAQLMIGTKMNFGAPEVVYNYIDEYRKLVFQVVRYPKDPQTGKKKILQRRPCSACDNGKSSNRCTNPKCRHGWLWQKEGTRKLLYHLPEVITANEVWITEGEKACDRLIAELEAAGKWHDNMAVTTSPEGAGKWRDEYSPYLTGKKVIVLPDNDDPGEAHAQTIAASSDRYAVGVKVVHLPELGEKEDVFDFFERGYKVSDLVGYVKSTAVWKPLVAAGTKMFISVVDFIKQAPAEKDWVIENLIEYKSNGFVIAKPKAGKSFSTVDMCIALASGTNWFDFKVLRSMRVAHLSREDNPDTTSWRYKQLLRGRGLDEDHIRERIYINTRNQTPRFMLDEEEWVVQLIQDMKSLGTEFFVLDVLNKMHGAEENDNTEMRQVMDRVDYISRETGAQWAIVHHYNKNAGDEDSSLTEMMRGASAIAGSAEWLVGYFLADEEKQIRKAKFDTKSSLPPKPFYWSIDSADEVVGGGIRIKTVDYERPVKTKRKSAAAAV